MRCGIGFLLCVVVSVACSSRSAVAPCKNKPEDLLSSSQVQSLYTITDSLFAGMHLRQCQLYVAQSDSSLGSEGQFTVRPNASHLRTSVYTFAMRGDRVELVK